MAAIKPFRAVRPQPELVGRVAALPYDVYNRAEACEEVAKEPLSFLRIDRAETQFGKEVDTYAPQVYEKARDLLLEDISKGIYLQDETPCYYIYEQVMNGRTQVGIAACASIDDYTNNLIKKHENTRADKEVDRFKHVDTCSAQTGPIFLACHSNSVINEVVAKVMAQAPLYDFTTREGIASRVWLVAETEDITTLEQAFAGIDSIYIADGHHRAASAVKVGLKRREEHPDYDGSEEFNYFLSVLFSDDQLMIMPYNRVAADLNGLSEETFLEKVQTCFTLEAMGETAYSPEAKGIMGMYLNHQWYKLTAKPEILSEDAVAGLDVSLLYDHILAPILNIQDLRTDKRVDFIGGIRGLSELERRCNVDMTLAFAMYPTAISELFAVSDAGRLMPPKSTWFEPKLLSGLFIHRI